MTPGYKYWFSAAFEDRGQGWAADSARFVFISAQMEDAIGFNLTLSLHYQVVKIYFKFFFGDSLIKLTIDSGYEKCIYSRAIGHSMATVLNTNFCADNGLTNANASQNKKRSNATHKPNAQLLHILFCPTAQRPSPKLSRSGFIKNQYLCTQHKLNGK